MCKLLSDYTIGNIFRWWPWCLTLASVAHLNSFIDIIVEPFSHVGYDAVWMLAHIGPSYISSSESPVDMSHWHPHVNTPRLYYWSENTFASESKLTLKCKCSTERSIHCLACTFPVHRWIPLKGLSHECPARALTLTQMNYCSIGISLGCLLMNTSYLRLSVLDQESPVGPIRASIHSHLLKTRNNGSIH